MLEIKNIHKTYYPKKGQPIKALKNINITFEDKGMVFLLGKSGCGKSTLLNIIGGLDSFDEGEIIIKGKSSKEFSSGDFDSYRNTFIGFIFQEYNILKEFNVAKNVSIALELQGKKADKKEVDKLLQQVGMQELAKRKVNELSGGQKQRVAIARALIKEPEIIFADEPTGALDSTTGKQVFETLKQLSKTKLVVVVSHDREFAEIYGDRIVELADGEIINDITKHSIEPLTINSGLNVIDNSLMQIKKGHKLTKKEIDFLIEKLHNSEEEIMISSDKTYNDNIKQRARINSEGKVERFKETTDEDIKTESYNKNDLKLIKSKLKYKDSLKMSISGFKVKPLRLLFTILLSMVSLGLFGLADTVGSYNRVDATIMSIRDSNIQNLTISKKFKQHWSENNYNLKTVTMTQAEFDTIVSDTGINFKPVFVPEIENWTNSPTGISMSQNYYKSSQFKSGLHFSELYGLANFTKEELEGMGFTIHGQMPQSSNEIAISAYTFEMFKLAGFIDTSVTPNVILPAENINSFQDIIGKKIKVINNYYEITAIIDTDFNKERYAPLQEGSSSSLGAMLLMSELADVIGYGFHGIGYVIEDVIEDLVQNANNIPGIGTQKYGFLNYKSSDNLNEKWVRRVLKTSEFTDNDYLFFDESKTELEENEMLISLEWLSEEIEEFNTTYYNWGLIWQIVNDYVTESIFEDIVDLGYTKTREQYVNDLLDRSVTGLFYRNPYGIPGNDIFLNIQQSVIIENWNEIQNMIPEVFKIKYSERFNNNDEIEREIDVVGVYFPYSYMLDLTPEWINSTSTIVVNDEWYSGIEEMDYGLYNFALASIPQNDEILRDVINYTLPTDSDTLYKMKNAVAGSIDQVNSFIEITSIVFLYVGIGFAVFSALMLMNFIGTSISHKKQEIGILRAMGARSIDVFGIFFNESLIITLINFTLSLIACNVAIFFINRMMRQDFGILLTILNFGIRQVLLMFAISILVSFVASLFPVRNIARKKPIDAINNK